MLPVSFFFLLFASLAYTQLQDQPKLAIFKCHEMMPEARGQILTFEFTNPQTNSRGVACAIATGTDSAYFYIEEEARPGALNHLGSLGFAKRTPDGVLTGNLWRFGEEAEETSQNPALPFTLNTGTSQEDFWTLQISGKSLIWQPRSKQGVANWQMSPGLIPRACPGQMHELHITDPIPHSVNESFDHEGVVCIKADANGTHDFFAIGRRRAEGSGELRKFVNFGRMNRTPSSHTLHGKLINLSFFTGKDVRTERDSAKMDMEFRAIPSPSGHSILLLDDLKEKWIAPGMSEADMASEVYII